MALGARGARRMDGLISHGCERVSQILWSPGDPFIPVGPHGYESSKMMIGGIGQQDSWQIQMTSNRNLVPCVAINKSSHHSRRWLF